MKKSIIIIVITLLSSLTLSAQNISGVDPNAVKTIEGTVNEVLKLISGEKGKVRNWQAYRELFAPDAKLTALNNDSTGKAKIKSWTVEQYIKGGEKYYKSRSFFEYELKKTINEYNGIAQVFQGYLTKRNGVEEKGINSFQLYFDGERWWITNVLWVGDDNGVDLPAEYDK
ncbi:MAG: hypothetical protein ACEPOW_10810 [Bacteroidales bacterium]